MFNWFVFSVERVQVLVEQAMTVFVLFKEDKAKTSLSFNEEQIHKFEKYVGVSFIRSFM